MEQSGFELAIPRRFFIVELSAELATNLRKIKAVLLEEHCRHAFALNRFSPRVMMFGICGSRDRDLFRFL